ncbi:MAG: ROK family protein [Lachnospiraceae bacterium]|jgi:glucokinase|nr:ROK family protein [Lachnospiraceae bacterium]
MATMVLDVGGTAIKSGLYENGALSDIQETSTEAKEGARHVVSRMKHIIASYQNTHTFHNIGISTAGQVDPSSGCIIYANENIPGYTGTKLKEIMEQEFQLPTAVENDVNAAAIGEAAFGAGKGQKDFVCLTYGTGVGGAMFTNGKLYSGSSHSAGEFGGIVTHPEDRNPGKDLFSGCYERYASTTALVKNAMALNPSLSNGRAIFEHQADPEVKQAIDRWIMEIVYGLITIVHMANPSCAILGGGVMEQPYVLQQVQEKLYQNIMPSFRHVQIKKASLGNQAGMLGAAVLNNPPA